MSDGLPWHRIQFAFSITFHYLFPQLTMGLALLIVLFKSLALRLRDEFVRRGRPVLGPDLRPQLRDGGGNRHPDGVPVRDQLVPVLPLLRRAGRPGPGDGRRVRVLPRVDVPGPVPVRREAARPEEAPRVGRRPGPGLVAVGLFHHRRQRLHAAPGRLSPGRGRGPAPGELPALYPQPLGAVAVRPHHVGLARHGLVRRRRRRSLLVLDGQPRPARGDLPACGGRRWPGFQRAGRLPDRGRPGEAGDEAPAGDAGRDGGALRGRARCGTGDHRAARRRRPQAGEPGRRARVCSASWPTGRSAAPSTG